MTQPFNSEYIHELTTFFMPRRRVAPLFIAYLSATVTNVTGDGTDYTIIFDTEVEDREGDYNSATGVFTAPVSGFYLLIPNVHATDLGAFGANNVRLITSNRTYRIAYMDTDNVISGTIYAYTPGGLIVDMDAGDTASVRIAVSAGGKTVDVLGGAAPVTTSFMGYLLI